MFRVIATVAIALTALFASAGNVRQENFTRQYQCAVKQVAVLTARPGPTIENVAQVAAETCVTPTSLAVEYTGHTKYENRNPDTLAKELAERRSYIVSALCRGTSDGEVATQPVCVRAKRP